ncbi:hypothetical protein EV1_035279 [Malus domestica]
MVTAPEKKVERGGTDQATVEELQHRQQRPWSPLRVFCCRDGDSGGGACGAWMTSQKPCHRRKRPGGACYASLGCR